MGMEKSGNMEKMRLDNECKVGTQNLVGAQGGLGGLGPRTRSRTVFVTFSRIFWSGRFFPSRFACSAVKMGLPSWCTQELCGGAGLGAPGTASAHTQVEERCF